MALLSRSMRLACGAAVALASSAVLTLPLSAQAPPKFTSPYTPPKSTYVPPKTPWGDPDIQGVYDYQDNIPMERPAQFAGKSIRDHFVVGDDVDLTSRATISVRAAATEIRESARRVSDGLSGLFFTHSGPAALSVSL